MKQILPFAASLMLAISANSQTVLNEIYSEPGSGKSEFIELYNSATGIENTDCFTILTYWSSGANHGWYVLDLPSTAITAKGWYVIASASPFNVQNKTNVAANTNWNDASFRNGSTGGYLKKYQQGVSAFTDLGLADGSAVTDLSVDGDFAGGGHNYLTLLFKNGAFINGFWGGGPTGTLPASIKSMPNLTITPAGVCTTPFTIVFGNIGAVEFVNESPGSDNGYARTSDGKCGAWDKTAPGVSHTPGLTNGGAAGLTGSLTTTEALFCNTGPAVSTVNYSITGVSGSATETDDFPVTVQLYYDYGTPGQLDGADVFVSQQTDVLIADPAKSFTVSQTQPVLLVYKTQRGCFDKIIALANSCLPLPVNFKSFSAERTGSNVFLKWETITEDNSTGFAIDRNNGNGWTEIGFVNTQAAGGFSNAILSYNYTDVNNSKGITQYRLRQIDRDNRARFSAIRSVRGENQKGNTIAYPNPSFDGKINVFFEDVTGTRDLVLTDMNGRILKKWTGYTDNNLKIENLVPGMYTLRIVLRETGEQTVQKLVISKR